MTKLRIGYHTNAISIGGADIYLRQMLSNIDKKKYEVVLFCKKEYPVKELFNGKVDFEIRFFNYGQEMDQKTFFAIMTTSRKKFYIKLLRFLWKKISFGSLKLLFGTFRDIKKMTNALKEYNLDILHSNDGGSESMTIAARLARVPLVLASYCVLPDPPDIKKSGDVVRRIIEWFSVRCLDRAIVKTQKAKRIWLKRLKVNASKFDVIPNGLDLSIFNTRPDIEKIKYELGIDFSTSIVGISARLHPMKGHKYLIQAIPKIIKQMSDIKFLFAGNGFIKDELLNMVKDMGLDSYVKFLGFRKDLDKLTWIYDIPVLPSVSYETFGWSIIEAMACRKPVVASNFSGIPEVVEDGITGILVPPKDPDALAKAIIELLKDKEKAKRMGEAGRKKVEKFFTQDIMLKKTYKLYGEALNV